MNKDFLSRILWCTKCDLHKTRNNVVVGNGNENADIILVGEAAQVPQKT